MTSDPAERENGKQPKDKVFGRKWWLSRMQAKIELF
jgi:hypothetical protein